MAARDPAHQNVHRSFPAYAWVGLLLTATSWWLNWSLQGLRTYWAFFPLWLGYCLTIDGLVRWRSGTSLMTRDPRRYIGLFLISAPAWWLFELFNLRTQNWHYIGAEFFTPGAYAFWTTLSFSTVMPAVFGAAELMASFPFFSRLLRGPRISADRRTTVTFFSVGWISLALLLIWPRCFFPLVWISVFFILEPLNIWLGNASLTKWTRDGDWRPVIALWLGVLMTAFFWEMWNFYSFPKWIYQVTWGDWWRVFEMPLLGYGGYLPFALELYTLYHLVMGMLGHKRADFVRLAPVE